MSNEDIESLEIISFWVEVSKSVICGRAEFIVNCAEKLSEFAGFLVWHHDVVDVLEFEQCDEVVFLYDIEECSVGVSHKSNGT